MSVRIKLNEGESVIATVAAVMRYAVNRAAGVVDRKGGPQSTYETDLNGVGAEMAFGKFRNLYPDFSITPRSGGSDFVDPQRGEIDIKSTKYKNGALLVNPKKMGGKTGVYVLVAGEIPEYNIVGYATPSEIFREENLITSYGREVYELKQCKLHPITE